MKKTLALLLTLLLLASIPAVAFASGEKYTEGTLYYTIGDGTITIVGCFGKKTEITVPSSIGGLPVNTIASGAFVGNKYLKVLNLPDTITTVEGGAIGGGISVVYNCNTDHPSSTPTELILGTAPEAVPAVELEPTPAPVESNTGSGTAAASGGAQGSGTEELDDAAPGQGGAPVYTAGGSEEALGDVIAESDIDLDELEAEEAQQQAAPALEQTPEATGEATPEPDATADQADEARSGGVFQRPGDRLYVVLGLFLVLLLAIWIRSLVVRNKRKSRKKNKQNASGRSARR